MPKPPGIAPAPSHQYTPEVTQLDPQQEVYFKLWAQANGISDVDKPDSYYDYRGFWKDNGPVPMKFGQVHFPDTYKQHGHPTFSVESKYSKGPWDGGMWLGDTFIPQPEPARSHTPAREKDAPLNESIIQGLMPQPANPIAHAAEGAKGIVPDRYAQWFSDHPILGGLGSAISPALDPHAQLGPVDLLAAAAPLAGVARAEPLATDLASRMARAKDMGFTTDVYRGRSGIVDPNKNFEDLSYFRPPYGDAGIHVDTNPVVANRAVQSRTGHSPTLTGYSPNANVMALKAKIQNPLEMPDVGIWKDPVLWKQALEDFQGEKGSVDIHYDAPVYKELLDAANSYSTKLEMKPKNVSSLIQHVDNVQEQWSNTFRNILRRHGYDSIKYPNFIEGKADPSGVSTSYLLLDPSQVRSRNALFDPARAKSGNLLASLLAPIGLAVAGSSGEQEK